MSEAFTSRKPIEMGKPKGLVLTCKIGNGVRITVNGEIIDVVLVAVDRTQVRVAIDTGKTKHQIDRTICTEFEKP